MRRPSVLPQRRPSTTAALIDVAIFGYVFYELHHVYKGTHPVMSRRLEIAGLHPRQGTSASGDSNKEGLRVEGETEKSEEKWTSLNGVPVPSFEMLMRPFRKQ